MVGFDAALSTVFASMVDAVEICDRLIVETVVPWIVRVPVRGRCESAILRTVNHPPSTIYAYAQVLSIITGTNTSVYYVLNP